MDNLSICQVCGRAIKAKSGLIAHHGYKRPGYGWQTSSCLGARYVPYEESCDRLKDVAETVRNFISTQEAYLADFLANPPETITTTEYKSSYRDGKEVVYTRPENFNPDGYLKYKPRTYENVYDTRKYEVERSIKSAKSDLASMERRIEAWKPLEVVS